jgi:hypothetical protein
VEVVRGVGALAVHVDNEMRVLGEERLLPVRVATVRAVSVCVDQLTDREPVGGLLGEIEVCSIRSFPAMGLSGDSQDM